MKKTPPRNATTGRFVKRTSSQKQGFPKKLRQRSSDTHAQRENRKIWRSGFGVK